MASVTNWGKYPVIDAEVITFSSASRLAAIVQEKQKMIARGLGRCYGDSALSETIISTLRYNRMLSFNEETGILECESGVTFDDILKVFVPRGWFLPVTPGTKFITLGGAIASDVHGKNHHVEGSFSNLLLSFDLMLSDESIVHCTKTENSDLFWATCGGMGLTGIILKAAFPLVPIDTSYIMQEIIRTDSLDSAMDVFEESAEVPFSVAWIDCISTGKNLGRSVVNRGDWAAPDQLPNNSTLLKVHKAPSLSVPFSLPSFTLNPFSVKLFNKLYYAKAPKQPKTDITSYDSFFYPLDGISDWNRIYGKKGFTQYQFVLPLEQSRTGMKRILEEISQSGQASFLAVLKLFGKQNGLLSFPAEGYTLALDFKITRSLFPLLNKLDELVLTYGGRLYLTKDVRMSSDFFFRTYEQAALFKELKQEFDKRNAFQSLQSQRIGL